MNAEPLPRAGELAFVEQAHSWQAENNERRGLMFGRGEKGRNAGLIVVFEEMGATSKELIGRREEMTLNGGWVFRDEMVVEALVVGEIKTEFLQARLQAPVDFGQKEKRWKLRAHRLNGFGPEFRTRGWKGGGERAPGFGKYVVENEHRHVAADAVTQASDALEFCEHGLAGGWIAVIKLDGIDPGTHVWVLAAGQPAPAFCSFAAKGIGAFEAAMDKEFRTMFDPGMIVPEMIGNEIQNQTDSVTGKLLAKGFECGIAPQRR